MASSFIDFKDKGIWFRDGLLRYAAMYLYKEMMKNPTKEEWIDSMATLVKDNMHGHFNGFMHFNFDKYLTSSKRIKIFQSMLDKTIAYLKTKDIELNMLTDVGDVMDDADFRIFSDDPYFFSRDRLILVLIFINRLLNEEALNSTQDSESYLI